MRIFYWNIRGVRKAAASRALHIFLRDYSPDVVCIAEPMVDSFSFPDRFFNRLGFMSEFIHNSRLDKVPNLWVVWKNSLARPVVVQSSEQMISVSMQWNGQQVVVSVIHASCFRAERRNLWVEMGIVAALFCPWVVLGDFNATLYSHEKRGPGRFNVGSAAEFQAMVDACDLISSPSQGSNFTWTNNRCRGHVAARLDRSFFNAQWLDAFGDCGQKVLHRSISDHAPILFSSAAIPKPRNAPFRLHRFWMKEESFVDLVRDVWSREVRGGPIGRLAYKLRAVKGALKGWARQTFPNLDVALKEATAEVEEVQQTIDQIGMSDELYSREAEAKSKLLKAVEMHEKLWAEKARCNWAKLGDRNSKFFHLSVKVRRIKNSIRALKKQDGTMVSEPLQMADYVSFFFENFHKADHCIDHMELLQVIPNEVNREDSSILEAIPAKEEIKKVVWGLDPDSSPGPDGFPGAFFIQCWEIVGDDFCGAVIAFFRGGKLPNGVNNSFVTLIPKVEGAISLDKFRPICMANFFCKVLSKIMAERLSCLLPRLVSDEQGAFQKGKIISSNIGLASELANLLHTSVRGGGMGIKIDVQKAYDTLSWDFLFAVLKKFGFSDVWLAWIHEILVSSRISVLLNGGPVGFFGVEKGAKHVRCLREFLINYQDFSGQKISLEKSKGWQGKLLSMAGRAELIRSVILVKKITVKWEEICRPKEEGGLGIRRLRDVNCAVISKLVWQMKHEESAFSSFLRARFVNEGGDLKKGYRASSVFKGIAKMWNFVSLSERWMSEFLKDIFKAIGNISLPQGQKDRCCWSLSSLGAFSTKSAWEALRKVSPKVGWAKMVWSSVLIPRQSVFGWRLIHGKLPCDDKVKRKGVLLPSRCEVCNKAEESINHLFVKCDGAVYIWRAFAEVFGFHWSYQGDDFLAHASWWTQKSKSIGLSQLWMAGLILVPYFIWMERNSRRFRGLHRSYGQVFHTIIEEIRRRGPGKNDRIKSRLDSERCLKLNIEVPRRKTKGVQEIFWLPPMDGWWKLNCDGSSLGNPGNAGAGGIIRNSKCQIVAIYSSYLGIASNFHAEFNALIEGIERARELNCASLWIECDSGAVMAAKKEASTSVVEWPPEVLDFMAEDAMGISRFRFY
ncbi:uncharacterized protein LOC122074306 [Macadamia integrifolia]|uniref:uncharacterized protein LOC122074306 n=1 Tax=Macadamia integrifolia TaxID=60698 RepID=UPI001C4FC78B|nr:uncharacterized protein LOC122074306 [Macadamia integrifolia]